MRDKVRVFITYILLTIVYIYFVYNYIGFNICKQRGAFIYLSLLWGGVCLFAVYRLRIKKDNLQKILYIMEIIILPLMSTLVIEIICNPQIKDLQLQFIFINYILLLAIEVLLIILLRIRSRVFALKTFSTIALIFGIINYFVIKFRGIPIMPADITAIRTALSVPDNYEFVINESCVRGSILYIVQLCLISYIGEVKVKYNKRNRLKHIYSAIYIILFVGLLKINYLKVFQLTLDGWTVSPTYYQYGSPFAFLLEVQQLKPEKVKGYSVAKAQSILNERNSKETDETSHMPNIIVIMNESFSDLSVLGDINTDSYLSNWKNSSFVMRGYAYSSVYGGGTCNSEFEMLTGSSIAFISKGGIYPYQNFDLRYVDNLVRILKEDGYASIAVHPAEASNYNRKRVYKDLGFDEFLSKDDFIEPEYYHGFISDMAVYNKIIELYEKKSSSLFIFGVTMQNHGGYARYTLGSEPIVNIQEQYMEYEQLVTYLTLVNESDRAFKYLYEYFKNVDEPTIVCMFGDHQPGLNNETIEYLRSTSLEEKSDFDIDMEIYKVPYIIFSNYEMEMCGIETDLSINYLGSTILKLIHNNDPYFRFISKMQEDIPVINIKGYLTVDGQWHEIDEINNAVKDYEIVQYYNLFDRKK